MEGTRTPIKIVVYGTPAPAGSKTSTAVYRKDPQTGRAVPVMTGDGRVITRVRDANPDAGSWKESVAQRAREQYDGPVLTGAVRLEVTFFTPRGANHYGTGRNAGRLKDSAPLFVTKKPDALKLARAVEDALTNVVWADDALVWQGAQRKVWVERTEPAGCEILVTPEPVLTVGDQRGAGQGTLALVA
jgi:Holliday junction resolvase RusA-like endonuclease